MVSRPNFWISCKVLVLTRQIWLAKGTTVRLQCLVTETVCRGTSRTSSPLAAIYVHCAAHSLNLCLVKASKQREIRAAITLMHEIAVFYRDSNKRLLNLQQFIDNQCPESSHTRLKRHCATRSVEKQNAVFVFKELYPAVTASLKDIASWPGDNGSKASIYLKSLDGAFLVTLEILDAVLQVRQHSSCAVSRYHQLCHLKIF